MIDRDTPPDHTADDGHVDVANIGWVPSIALDKDCAFARLEKGWVSRNSRHSRHCVRKRR